MVSPNRRHASASHLDADSPARVPPQTRTGRTTSGTASSRRSGGGRRTRTSPGTTRARRTKRRARSSSSRSRSRRRTRSPSHCAFWLLCVTTIPDTDAAVSLAVASPQRREPPPARPPPRPPLSIRTLRSSPKRPRMPPRKRTDGKRMLARPSGPPGARRRPKTRTGTTSRAGGTATTTATVAGETIANGIGLGQRAAGKAATSARAGATANGSGTVRSAGAQGHRRHHGEKAGGIVVGPRYAGDGLQTCCVY